MNEYITRIAVASVTLLLAHSGPAHFAKRVEAETAWERNALSIVERQGTPSEFNSRLRAALQSATVEEIREMPALLGEKLSYARLRELLGQATGIEKAALLAAYMRAEDRDLRLQVHELAGILEDPGCPFAITRALMNHVLGFSHENPSYLPLAEKIAESDGVSDAELDAVRAYVRSLDISTEGKLGELIVDPARANARLGEVRSRLEALTSTGELKRQDALRLAETLSKVGQRLRETRGPIVFPASKSVREASRRTNEGILVPARPWTAGAPYEEHGIPIGYYIVEPPRPGDRNTTTPRSN